MGGASGGGDRGGEEAQALSPRSGDAGEAGPAGTGALCLPRSEEQEEGGRATGKGEWAGWGEPTASWACLCGLRPRGRGVFLSFFVNNFCIFFSFSFSQ